VRQFTLLALVALSLSTVSPVFAGSSDIVPRGDLAYDLVGSLAASGRLRDQTLADFFRGDRLYTRSEMAGIIRQMATSSSLSAEDVTAVRALEMEFSPELHDLTIASGKPLPSSMAGRLTGDVKIRALSGPAALEGLARGTVTLPIGSSGYAALGIGNWRDEWYDRNAPLHGYPLMETAFARVNGRVLDVTVGRMPLRWGPGYAGGMLLSNDAPSVPQIRLEKTFVPGGWLRRLGTLHFEQFDGQFFEPDDPSALPDARGTRRYLVARRLETAGTGRWALSIGEAIKSTRLPSPIAANILPLYLYQNEATASSRHHILGSLVPKDQPDTYWKNYVADVNIAYRLGGDHGVSLYNDLLLDDFKTLPGLGMGGPTPRKLGEQIGIYAADLFHARSRFAARLEYATIDTGTYANVSAPVAYTDEGVSLGHPAGPNANVLFGRFEFAATPRLHLALEGARRRPKEVASPAAADTDRASGFATYTLRRDAFVGARLEHIRTRGGADSHTTRASVSIGAGF